MKYSILLVLILTACGQKHAPINVDPALAPYLSSFETDTGVSAGGVSAGFQDTTVTPTALGEVVGECVSYDNGDRQIWVDQDYWLASDQSQRIQLIYHELGHCAMNLQHVTQVQNNGCPISIMYPYTFGDLTCFFENETKYFDELRSLYLTGGA